MNQLQKTDKRIVSKSKYVADLSTKVTVASFGTVIFFVGFMCLLLTCGLGILMLLHLSWAVLYLFLFAIGILGSGSVALLYLGAKIIKEAKETEVGIPLTRANTRDLSAPESLVRASQEPVQAQKSILLRAAMETTEKQEAELLRASGE